MIVLPMYWLARSPEMNPIEYVWYIIGWRVRKRNSAPRNVKNVGGGGKVGQFAQVNDKKCQEEHWETIRVLKRGRESNTSFF